MAEYLEQSLQSFRPCFSREHTFKWFVIIIVAFILRDDHLGVTSTIRALLLDHGCYVTMMNFFRSEAYTTQALRNCWYRLVLKQAPLLKIEGQAVLAGDGVKQSKEGFFMPGVEKLHQDSEDSSKGEYIFGHMFGAVGVMICQAEKYLCLPLRMSIQNGVRAASSWKGSTVSGASHVVQMIDNSYEVAQVIGKSILLLDRYFLTVPALVRLSELNNSAGGKLISIVTKAKRNCKAFEKPVPNEGKKPGKPKKRGTAVALNQLFNSCEKEFISAEVQMYGKRTKVKYLCRNLLWGAKLYQELRFVLVVTGDLQCILVSTDLTLSPENIIELYSYRFKIESCFREFKQQFGGFCYHFWTKAIGKLNHFKRKDDPDRLSLVTEYKFQKRILKTIDATERYVQMACIAMGLVQMIIFSLKSVKDIQNMRYLRTYRDGTISEETLKYYLRRTLLFSLATKPNSMITRYIQEHQGKSKGRKRAA